MTRIAVDGETGGWSWLIEGDDLELPSTSVRVRYQPNHPWQLAVEVKANRDGSRRVRRRLTARKISAERYVTDDVWRSLQSVPSFHKAVGDSYSGDSKSPLRVDAIRVQANALLTTAEDQELLVTGAIAWATHLQSLDLLGPRVAPPGSI